MYDGPTIDIVGHIYCKIMLRAYHDYFQKCVNIFKNISFF